MCVFWLQEDFYNACISSVEQTAINVDDEEVEICSPAPLVAIAEFVKQPFVNTTFEEDSE